MKIKWKFRTPEIITGILPKLGDILFFIDGANVCQKEYSNLKVKVVTVDTLAGIFRIQKYEEPSSAMIWTTHSYKYQKLN